MAYAEAVYNFYMQRNYDCQNAKVLELATDNGKASRFYLNDRLIADRSYDENGEVEVIISNAGHPNKRTLKILNEIIKTSGHNMGTIYEKEGKWAYMVLDTEYLFPNDVFVKVK